MIERLVPLETKDIKRADFDELINELVDMSTQASYDYRTKKSEPANRGRVRAFRQLFEYISAWADNHDYLLEWELMELVKEDLTE